MPTIYDVAQHAGVSTTTVSAVLNGKKNRVSEQTRRKILKSINDLNYSPSRVARQLATGRFNTYALCFERTPRRIFTVTNQLISGAGDAVSDEGISILLVPTRPDILTAANADANFEHMIKGLHSHGVDGAIVFGPISLKKQVISTIEDCDIPVVCVDSYPAFSKTSTVDADNATCMRSGLEHLISQGHKRIVYISRPPVFQLYVDRMRGFCEVMQENSLPVDAHTIRLLEVDRVPDLIHDIIHHNRPTAIVCADEMHGVAVWDALMAEGMRIPEDISMLVSNALPSGHPGAGVVNQVLHPQYEIGKAASLLLGQIIAGEKTPPTRIRLDAQALLFPSPLPVGL